MIGITYIFSSRLMTSQCGQGFCQMRPPDWLLGQAVPNAATSALNAILSRNQVYAFNSVDST